ncbi:MAG: histidine phosphatase family protein [Timaviella obliquedivisa GSE-PSE-MK23-08B]|jgi:probable phosphoglycerate mutase|nr:histidine phosphatase family protein [Timaviella obliquedivisa GSE-PSE-MK23-08B]
MRSLFKLEQTNVDVRETNRTTRVILIRHGRSTFNEKKLYQGSSDLSVLTEQGWQTAKQVGQFLKNEPIAAIYTSPLKRVRQTVDAILGNLSSTPPLWVQPGLREIDLQSWEGQSFQFVQETYAADYQCWKHRPHEFELIPNAVASLDAPSLNPARGATVAIQTRSFPVLDLYERSQQFWQEVLCRHPGQTIAVVSHGGTNRALISTALGLPPSQFHRLQQSNCGISFLHFPDACLNAAQLKTLNLTTPLKESLPKLKEGKQGLRLLLLPSETNSRSIDHLAQLLQTISIDFSLAADSEATLIDRLLHYHPTTVQLQSQQHRFLLNWQRTLETTSSASSQLMTGLVVAAQDDIQQVVGAAIGLSRDQHWRLQPQPGALSVLHYPVANSPVLQAFNFA